MNDNKPWYASSGVWGGILAAGVGLVALITHTTITQADVSSLAGDLAAIGGAVGGIIAVYGRIKATKKIGGAK